MTRRSLIQRALVILGMGPAGGLGCASHRVATKTSRPVEATLDAPSEGGRLSPAELEDCVAFGEVLVEGRTLGAAERQYLAEHIDGRTTRTADYLSLYRGAVSTLDRVAGRRFAALEIQERIDLVARHRLAAAPAVGEHLSEEMRLLRTRVVPDIIRGYYASPAGWAVVGYDSFPGRCGDVTRYARPEA